MKKVLSIALLSMMAICSQAQAADDLNYSYVQGGYLNIDGDLDGWGLSGSVNLGESNFYGFAGFTNIESGFIETTQIGVGYHHSISDSADLIAELGYVSGDVLGGLLSNDGYSVAVGFRNAFSDNVEGILKVNYVDFSGADGEFSVQTGLVYHVNENIGIVGGVEFADNVNTFALGLRGNF